MRSGGFLECGRFGFYGLSPVQRDEVQVRRIGKSIEVKVATAPACPVAQPVYGQRVQTLQSQYDLRPTRPDCGRRGHVFR